MVTVMKLWTQMWGNIHLGDKSYWWIQWTGICRVMHQAVLP